MDAWKNASVLQEKPVHKILVLGGGVFWVFGGGGGSADFIFMGARIFLILEERLEAEGCNTALPPSPLTLVSGSTLLR